MTQVLLDVNDLQVTFNTPTGQVHAVRGIDLALRQGEVLGVVGESGSGKSATFRALLGLAPPSANVRGDVGWMGSLTSTDDLRSETALIYQNPGAALNPVFTIGEQLALAAGTKDSNELAGMLDRVGLPEPEKALDSYPHEFSGGMRQRAVIAFALAQRPRLLVADEPTTALDVTTQAQILDLLQSIRAERDLTVAFISHDLAVISQIADRVAVLYAGRVVEIGRTADVLNKPQHPYTEALIRSMPTAEQVGGPLRTIAGNVPDGRSKIRGCAFAERCEHAVDACAVQPEMRASDDDHFAACVRVGAVS